LVVVSLLPKRSKRRKRETALALSADALPRHIRER
jgi:hypothetical protein